MRAFTSTRRRVWGITAVAAVLGTAAVLLGPLPAEAMHKRFTLHLAEDRGGAPCVTQLDTNGDGSLDAGDVILENKCDVLDGNGSVIGHYSTVVTVLGETGRGPAGFVDCVVTLASGSKLSFSGPGDLADVATSGINLVVTGGTGRYAGAGGEVNIVHVAGSPATASFKLSRR